MTDHTVQIEALQRTVDKHERILSGDGISEPGIKTQLALIQQGLDQLKLGVRTLLIAGATWLVTHFMGLL